MANASFAKQNQQNVANLAVVSPPFGMVAKPVFICHNNASMANATLFIVTVIKVTAILAPHDIHHIGGRNLVEVLYRIQPFAVGVTDKIFCILTVDQITCHCQPSFKYFTNAMIARTQIAT
jgi:hypothetical protein